MPSLDGGWHDLFFFSPSLGAILLVVFHPHCTPPRSAGMSPLGGDMDER